MNPNDSLGGIDNFPEDYHDNGMCWICGTTLPAGNLCEDCDGAY